MTSRFRHGIVPGAALGEQCGGTEGAVRLEPALDHDLDIVRERVRGQAPIHHRIRHLTVGDLEANRLRPDIALDRPGHDLRASTNDAHALSVRTSANGDAIFTSAHAELTQIFTGARTADGFPVPVTHGASTALVRSGDGRLGIAVAGSDQQLYYYTTPTEVEARDLLWRSRFGDEHNSAQVAPSGDAPAFPATFFPQERCYNWPNPVYDQVTKIRFFVSLDASVTVKIYDVAGEKVDELHAGAIGGTDNEIDWNVRDVQSDIYLAHVEVNAGGQTASKIIKIAVVK